MSKAPRIVDSWGFASCGPLQMQADAKACRPSAPTHAGSLLAMPTHGALGSGASNDDSLDDHQPSRQAGYVASDDIGHLDTSCLSAAVRRTLEPPRERTECDTSSPRCWP